MTRAAAEVPASLGLPGGRSPARPELERVVAALAARPDLWAPHAPAGAATRTSASLHRESVSHADERWALDGVAA